LVTLNAQPSTINDQRLMTSLPSNCNTDETLLRAQPTSSLNETATKNDIAIAHPNYHSFYETMQRHNRAHTERGAPLPASWNTMNQTFKSWASRWVKRNSLTGDARTYPTLWTVYLKKNIFHELPHHRPSATPRRSGHASSITLSSSSSSSTTLSPSARMQNDEQQQQQQHEQNDQEEESARYEEYEQDLTMMYNDPPAIPLASSSAHVNEPECGEAMDNDRPDGARQHEPQHEQSDRNDAPVNNNPSSECKDAADNASARARVLEREHEVEPAPKKVKLISGHNPEYYAVLYVGSEENARCVAMYNSMCLDIIKELKYLAYYMFRTFDTIYIDFRPFRGEWIVKSPNTPTNVSTFQQLGRQSLLTQLNKKHETFSLRTHITKNIKTHCISSFRRANGRST
jgi:hypothetical protein